MPTTAHRLGIVSSFADVGAAVSLVRDANDAGLTTVWTTMPVTGADTLTAIAAIGARTEGISLGTAILPVLGRHPVTVASQVLAIEQAAPGRLRLGVGTGNIERARRALGIEVEHPLAALREHVSALRSLLHVGRASTVGRYVTSDAQMSATSSIEVHMSALGIRAFEVAGEVSDGALSWLCPIGYLETSARPAMERGAQRAGRLPPPLVVHVTVALGRDRATVERDARPMLDFFAAVPAYATMLAAAGFPAATDGRASDRLVDEIIVQGDVADVEARLRALLDRGVDELMVSALPGADQNGEQRTLIELLGRLAH